MKTGVIIDSRFDEVLDTIESNEKAGTYVFSYDITEDEHGTMTTVDPFYAKLSYAEKYLHKAKLSECNQRIRHINYNGEKPVIE